MAKFGIYSTAGVKKAEGYPTFTGTYMKAGVLDFREIASNTPINWAVGDYVDYTRTGLRYKLYKLPQMKKQARSNTYGGAYVYQSVQFHDASYDLELCPFRDLVKGDNRVHFSTQPMISTFENVAGIATRLQACLDDMYGSGSWNIRLATVAMGATQAVVDLMNEARNFSVQGVSLVGALEKIYEVWPEIGWVYSVVSGVNTITIGGAGLNLSTSQSYSYGKGSGLKDITRVATNADELANRLYVYGSSRNMMSGWYRSKNIKDAESVDIQHLMIPIANWGTTEVEGVDLPDPAKAFVDDAASIARIGLRPKTIYFDGTGDQEEIYPTIRGMKISDVIAAVPAGTQYSPNTSIYTDTSVRVDTVRSVETNFDSGLSAESGKQTILSEYGTFSENSPIVILAGDKERTVTLYSKVITVPESGIINLSAIFALDGTITASDASLVAYIEAVDSSNTSLGKSYIELTQEGANWRFSDAAIEKFGLTFAQNDTVTIRLVVKVIAKATSSVDRQYVVGVDGELSASLERFRSRTFKITIRQIGFDISAQAALGNGKTIHFRTGDCAGRTFTIKNCTYQADTDSWLLEIIRSEDSSLSQWFPNSTYPVAADDEFVLLDIAMPDSYVLVAENKLLAAAQDYLGWSAKEVWQYTPDIDAKFMIEQSRVILPAQYITLGDTDVVDGDADQLVDTVNINEGESTIPTYKVTLRERKRVKTSTSATVEPINSNPVSSATPVNLNRPGSSFFEEDGQGGIQLKEDYAGLRTKGYLIGATDGGPGGGGGGGGLIERLWRVGDLSDDVTDFDNTANDTFNAYTINSLHTRIKALEQNPGGVSSVAGLTGDVSAPDLFTALGLGTAATRAVGAIQNANTGLVTGGDVYSFVNSSVATATATFRGTNTTATTEADFLTWADALTKTLNDYVFWKTTDSAGNVVFKRYKYGYDGTEAGSLAWRYEYDLNNSSFTAAQWAAINSGITSQKITGYDTVAAYFTNGVLGTANIPQLPTSKITGLDTALSNINTALNGVGSRVSDLEKMFIDDTYTVDGQTKHRIKVNSTYFEGLITTGFLIGAADGGPGGGGGGGIDLNLMWASLQNTTPDTHATDKFHKNHLPAIVASDGISAGYTLDSNNLATQLNIGISAIDQSKVSGLATTLAGYLPLSAGSGKALTGNLYLGGHNINQVSSISASSDISTTGGFLTVGSSTAEFPIKVVKSQWASWAVGIYTDNSTVHLSQGIGNGIVVQSTSSSSSVFLLDLISGQSTLGTGGTHKLYVRADGVIGVGTNNPSSSYSVDVAGTINATNIYENGTALSSKYLPLNGGGTVTSNDATVIRINSTASAETDIDFYRNGTVKGEVGVWDNTGIAMWEATTNSWVYISNVDGKFYKRGGYEFYHSGNSNLTTVPWSASSLTLPNGGYVYFKDTNSVSLDAFRLSSSNNLVIGSGTASEGYNTYIDGANVYIRYSTSQTPGITLSSSGAVTLASSLTLAGAITGATNIDSLLYFDTANSCVGIGTNSPGRKLDVRGDFDLYGNLYVNPSATAGQGISLWTNDAPTIFGICMSATSNYGSLGAVNSYATFFSMGNVSGAGWIFRNSSTGPVVSISNTGVVYATTGVISPGYGNFASSYSSSDQRLKDDITEIDPEYALEKLMSLRPCEWVWNERSTQAGKKGAGFIAQQVSPFFGFTVARFGEYMSINYDNYHGYEVSGIKGLYKMVKELKKAVSSQAEEIRILRSENAKLKERINA